MKGRKLVLLNTVQCSSFYLLTDASVEIILCPGPLCAPLARGLRRLVVLLRVAPVHNEFGVRAASVPAKNIIKTKYKIRVFLIQLT